MPFRRPGRPTYYIGPLSSGGIHIPRMSTGQKSKRTAKAMEAMLVALATGRFSDLVHRVVEGQLDLGELYTESIKGEKELEALRLREGDVLLTELISGKRDRGGTKGREGLRALFSDERILSGLDQLLALAPVKARRSWLLEPANITQLYRDAVAGADRQHQPRKPNSVRRSLHRAVSELLKAEVGRGRMLFIMADVAVPGANDERVVLLSPAEITDALAAAGPEFRPVLGLAITTGIDRKPSRETLVRDYDSVTGTLHINDTKARNRKRTLILRGEPVLENAEQWLNVLTAKRRPSDSLVSFTEKEIRHRWEAIRTTIGRPDVRWKDLRGIFATYYLQAGGEVRNLQYILGHSGMAMTLRYLRRVPVGNRERLREAAKSIGRYP